MKTKYLTLEEKEEILSDFLLIPKKYKKIYKSGENVYWIYKIICLNNDKLYIGKTNNIKRRALNYINEYLKGDGNRKLNKAMIKYGIDKFMLVPLEIAYNNKSASIKEKYYIDLYDTIDKGYNMIMGSTDTYTNRSRPSVPQTLYSRMIKSKLVCCVNDTDNKIVFSTGLKLFGDYIGRHKDEIKSAAKRETRLDGFFIYYLNNKDFNDQIDNANLKIDKNVTYKDYKLQYYDFIKISKIIKSFLKSEKTDINNFDIIFITQSNDECGYKKEPIEKFIAYYKTYKNKII